MSKAKLEKVINEQGDKIQSIQKETAISEEEIALATAKNNVRQAIAGVELAEAEQERVEIIKTTLDSRIAGNKKMRPAMEKRDKALAELKAIEEAQLRVQGAGPTASALKRQSERV